MGADFGCIHLPRAKLTDERRQQLLAGINVIPEEWFQEQDTDLEIGRADLREAVQVYIEAEERRDVSWCQLDGWDCAYYVTGGVSWGEPPTDAYESFCLLDECEPLYNLLHQWAQEDAKNEPEEGACLPALLKLAEQKGLKSEDLDEEVHELASSLASDVNNGGLESQLIYLSEHLGTAEVRKLLEAEHSAAP